LQVQVNEPAVSVQAAFTSQLSVFAAHSSVLAQRHAVAE
jgi:hypothetical protein